MTFVLSVDLVNYYFSTILCSSYSSIKTYRVYKYATYKWLTILWYLLNTGSNCLCKFLEILFPSWSTIMVRWKTVIPLHYLLLSFAVRFYAWYKISQKNQQLCEYCIQQVHISRLHYPEIWFRLFIYINVCNMDTCGILPRTMCIVCSKHLV